MEGENPGSEVSRAELEARYVNSLSPIPGTEFRPCLFDSSHTIPLHQRHSEDHFFKYGCLEVNPQLSKHFIRCTFNFSHLVLEGKMEEHLETCPAFDRWRVSQALTGKPLCKKP
jgi:hypothetical protein